MGDTPPKSDDDRDIPPSTTYSVAMTATAPVVPFFEAQQIAAQSPAADQIDLDGVLVNVWQEPAAPIEPVPGLVITPP